MHFRRTGVTRRWPNAVIIALGDLIPRSAVLKCQYQQFQQRNRGSFRSSHQL